MTTPSAHVMYECSELDHDHAQRMWKREIDMRGQQCAANAPDFVHNDEFYDCDLFDTDGEVFLRAKRKEVERLARRPEWQIAREEAAQVPSTTSRIASEEHDDSAAPDARVVPDELRPIPVVRCGLYQAWGGIIPPPTVLVTVDHHTEMRDSYDDDDDGCYHYDYDCYDDWGDCIAPEHPHVMPRGDHTVPAGGTHHTMLEAAMSASQLIIAMDALGARCVQHEPVQQSALSRIVDVPALNTRFENAMKRFRRELDFMVHTSENGHGGISLEQSNAAFAHVHRPDIKVLGVFSVYQEVPALSDVHAMHARPFSEALHILHIVFLDIVDAERAVVSNLR